MACLPRSVALQALDAAAAAQARGSAEQMVGTLIAICESSCRTLQTARQVEDAHGLIRRTFTIAILDAQLAAVAKTTTILDEHGLGAPRDPNTGEEMTEKASPAYRAQLEYFGALMSAREAVGK